MYRGSVFYANLSCSDENYELCNSLLGHRDFYAVTIANRRNQTCDLEIDILLKKRSNRNCLDMILVQDIILAEKDKINNIHFRKTSIEIFCSKSSSIQVELDENAFYTVFFFLKRFL